MLRKFIQEELGKQLEIHNISEYITDYIFNTLKKEQENINDGNMHYAIFPIIKTEKIIKKTKINSIKIDLTYIKNNEFKISGSFKSDKTRLAENGNYNVFVDIDLMVDDREIDLIKKNIESVVSHELNHAFVHIRQIAKNSKNPVYNKANKMVASAFKSIPELSEFTKMFYLALPQEIQARVQQTASELKYINSNDYTSTINQLMQHGPINDAKKMMNYNLNNVKKLDEKILNDFVTQFNINVKSIFGNDIKLKYNGGFFEHWVRIINFGGDKLFKKIMKLVADKHNIQELHLYKDMSDSLLKEISGDFFDLE